MAQRDGVADGWILYEAWCKRNGGIPIRGRNGGAHTCFVGPIDQTIDPGDDGTVDSIDPRGHTLPGLEVSKLDLAVSAAEVKVEQARLDLAAAKHLARAVKANKKK